MTAIRLYNTRTRTKEDFTPFDRDDVRMYVCGPTVYDRAHLGNARPVVVFDTLFRLLRHVYGEGHVTYVRNFTDVDDKINATALARKEAGAPGTLEDLIRQRTEETIGWYHADMDALGALRPTMEPRATEYIGAMIAMIQGLIDKGHAYEVEGHVLFDVRSYPDYGRLSGRSVDDMIAGARVEVAPYKRDPMDFVLWKPSDASLPGWESPWGRGRPGWHIECSAMSAALLGESFDIHGGGLDLLFPHHENEVAQSCCAHPHSDFARVWLHNEMLMVEGRKMSKSLGNFFTVRDLLDRGIPGEVIRYVFLMTHYRKPMDWTAEKVRVAEATLKKWHGLLQDASSGGSVIGEVVATLADDLNTAGAISMLHTIADKVLNSPAENNHSLKADFLASLRIMGLMQEQTASWAEDSNYLGPWMDRLVSIRRKARADKDFQTSDKIRELLSIAGIELKDGKEGFSISTDILQLISWAKKRGMIEQPGSYDFGGPRGLEQRLYEELAKSVLSEIGDQGVA